MGMTEAPARLTETPDLLRSALEQLRLDGAIFFRSELTEPFAFESTPNSRSPTRCAPAPSA